MFIVKRSQIDFLFFSGASINSAPMQTQPARGARRQSGAAAPLKNKKKDATIVQITINMAPLRGLGRPVGHPCKEQAPIRLAFVTVHSDGKIFKLANFLI